MTLSVRDAAGNSASTSITIILNTPPEPTVAIVIVPRARIVTPFPPRPTAGSPLDPGLGQNKPSQFAFVSEPPETRGFSISPADPPVSSEPVSAPVTASPVLWGGAAAGLIGAAMVVAMEAQRKRKEEEARLIAEMHLLNAEMRAKEKQEALLIAQRREAAAFLAALAAENAAQTKLEEEEEAWLEKKMARDEAMFGRGLSTPKGSEQSGLAALAAVIGAARVQREYEEPAGGKGSGLAMPVAQVARTNSNDDKPWWQKFIDAGKSFVDGVWNSAKSFFGSVLAFGKISSSNATATPTRILPTPEIHVVMNPTQIPIPTHTPSFTPSSALDFQGYKKTGPLTPWEASVGGRQAWIAHQMYPLRNDYEFWAGGIELNTEPPWAGQQSLINTPIPMVLKNNQFGWYIPENGQLIVKPVPNQDDWWNKYARTSENIVWISDIMKYTNNRIPFVCGDVPDWLYFMSGHNLQLELPEVSAKYSNRWPRASYAWVTMFNDPAHSNNTNFLDVRAIDNEFLFTDQNIPELGETIVTQFGNNPLSESPLDATHVVEVVEINGYKLDQIVVIEGNPSANTLTYNTLDDLIDSLSGDGLNFIVYGHPNLAP